MGKALGGTGVFVSILTGAIVWFVLQVIIGVVAWVSIIAGGGVALLGVLMALGAIGASTAGRHHRHHNSPLSTH